MGKWRLLLACLLVAVMSSVAASWQIGPEIRIGGGEATVGGVGVRNGRVVTPTPEQLLDTAINSTALGLLSDADKANVKSAIITTGFVSAVLADPVTGIIMMTVLTGSGQKTDVPVPTVEAPPTGKIISLAVTCIVQQDAGIVTAMTNEERPEVADIKFGDQLQLSAPYCKEYGQKSVTSVSAKFTGKSYMPDAAPPLFKYYLVGRTA